MSALSARSLERRFLLLTSTRWLQVGVVFGLTILLALQRGLSIAEVGVLLSIQGFVVLALELPSGSLADSLGRRPVLLLAAIAAIAATVLVVIATDFVGFALALLVQGVFRALDSGPLEAWFVDALGPDVAPAHVARSLGRGSTVLGASIAVGSAAGGLLVWWAPVPGLDPLLLPFLVALAIEIVHLVLLAVLVDEPRVRRARPAPLARADDLPSRRASPWATLRAAIRVVARDRVLRCLVLVEVAWALAMIGFETLTPIRLAELTDAVDAAAIFGPASAVAWGVFAAGSALCAFLVPRLGVVRVAIAARILNGVFVAVMGLLAGVVGLLVGYCLAYLAHGAAGPAHNALLHQRADARTRATVLSVNSLVAGGSTSLLLLVVLPLSEGLGTAPVLVAVGLASTLGALLYLPARERAGRRGT
ncbi:MFS transporter [Cnuibacter physcomitrellae]|uniref:MFS transporter n=1 Tax=Cnuibacter physcomitrellae TaxID=1619308 RepID=UPI0021760EDB|nr:MFS transporter [Cnuibacter physcomitrellae]MCS5498623.1 MFS transporter [Cnuibacter physcomitrellae]